jgi:hypothetical protein
MLIRYLLLVQADAGRGAAPLLHRRVLNDEIVIGDPPARLECTRDRTTCTAGQVVDDCRKRGY